jgi:hypothetical protein
VEVGGLGVEVQGVGEEEPGLDGGVDEAHAAGALGEEAGGLLGEEGGGGLGVDLGAAAPGPDLVLGEQGALVADDPGGKEPLAGEDEQGDGGAAAVGIDERVEAVQGGGGVFAEAGGELGAEGLQQGGRRGGCRRGGPCPWLSPPRAARGGRAAR